MKRSQNFLMRTVAGKQVIVPVGKAATAFPGMITVNGVGAYIWQLLEQEQTLDALVDALESKYEADRQTILADTQSFLEKLRSTGAIEE